MIDLGLVEWLIQRLSADAHSMKAYTLEYSAALLMNLCLHHRAKERCVPLAKTVLKLLMMLLGTKVTQVSPSQPPYICKHTYLFSGKVTKVISVPTIITNGGGGKRGIAPYILNFASR